MHSVYLCYTFLFIETVSFRSACSYPDAGPNVVIQREMIDRRQLEKLESPQFRYPLDVHVLRKSQVVLLLFTIWIIMIVK